MSTDRAISTVTLSNTWSYDRMMRLFGGMWFMLLALLRRRQNWGVAYRSLAIASVEFLPRQLLHAPGAVDHDPGAGKGAGGGPAA